MKKIHAILMVALVMVSCVFTSGCDPNNEGQAKVIAQQAGMWAAVGWIALDNPAPEQIGIVKDLMVKVEEGSKQVTTGKTYTEVLYPALVVYIDASVQPQYRPLAKTGVLSTLNGLDLLFVSHPAWREDEQLTHALVQSFILGANNGLSLSADDPIMQQARRAAAVRVRVFREARVEALRNQLRELEAQQRAAGVKK